MSEIHHRNSLLHLASFWFKGKLFKNAFDNPAELCGRKIKVATNINAGTPHAIENTVLQRAPVVRLENIYFRMSYAHSISEGVLSRKRPSIFLTKLEAPRRELK